MKYMTYFTWDAYTYGESSIGKIITPTECKSLYTNEQFFNAIHHSLKHSLYLKADTISVISNMSNNLLLCINTRQYNSINVVRPIK